MDELNIENAYGTALIVTDKKLFKDYIFYGLFAENRNDLIQFIEHPSFFVLDDGAINNLNHIIALRTFQRFGFLCRQNFNHFRQIMSVDVWLANRMPIVFTDQRIQNSIVNNQGLLDYVKSIVNRINTLEYTNHIIQNHQHHQHQFIHTCIGLVSGG